MWRIEDVDKELIERQEAAWAQHEERSVLRGQHPQPLPLSRALSATRMQDPRLRELASQSIPQLGNRRDAAAAAKSKVDTVRQSDSTAQLLREYMKSSDDERSSRKLALSSRGVLLPKEKDDSLAQTYFKLVHSQQRTNPYADIEDSRAFLAIKNRMWVKKTQAASVFRNLPYIDQDDAYEVTVKARVIRSRIPAAIMAGIAEENDRSKQYFDASKLGAHVAWKRMHIEISETRKENAPSESSTNAANKIARRGHSVTAIDANNLLIFAGTEGNKFYSTIYKLCFNPIRWEYLETTGSKPCGRAFHAVIFDNEENNLICFGGLGVHQSLNDCFELNITQRLWEPIFPEMGHAVPSPRHGHTLSPVSNGGSAVLFGGAGAGFYNDTYMFDIKTGRWIEPKVEGQPPAPRAFHTACSLISGSKIFVFGGTDGSTNFGDLHALEVGAECLTWTSVVVRGIPPCPRWGHCAMPNGMDSMVIFGGGGNSFCDDLYVYNAFSSLWTEFHGLGEAPVGRWGHAMALMEDSQTLFLLGGCGAGRDSKFLGDAFLCNLVHLVRGRRKVNKPSSTVKSADPIARRSSKTGLMMKTRSMKTSSKAS